MSSIRLYVCPLLVGIVFMLMLFVGDVEAKPHAKSQSKEGTKAQTASVPDASAPIWKPLLNRLATDGQDRAAVDKLFTSLPQQMMPAPMGRKLLELYRYKFIPSTPGVAPTPQLKYYKGTVTQANAEKCKAFLEKHDAAFTFAEEKFGVPRRVAVALLFVETRLGTNVGKNSALHSLASMALSSSPDMLGSWLGKLPEDYQVNLPWMRETTKKRAEWAYNELRALTKYMLRYGIDPTHVRGSIYGAIGMCQFMPSNIEKYGADGNGDGRIDLFVEADAIASLSRYLQEHGWKPGISREQQHAVLRKYNKSDVYAATILALSDVVIGEPVPADAE